MKAFPLSKQIGLFAGPILFFILLAMPEMVNPMADKVLAAAAWMVTWWITEAVSISVTALLPLVLFPLSGIMEIGEVSQNYGHRIVFLFFGGFIMALALEKVNLHKRIALHIIRLTGTSPNRIILGFMIATAVLSMWISNTASTLVMLPIALSVISLLINDEDGFTANDKNFALSIMLGIAFAANAGGIATIIGTPPNAVLVGFLEKEYQIDISFLNWLVIGLPFSILMISATYFVVVKIVFPNRLGKFEASGDVINKEIKKLGKISSQEKKVIAVFVFAIFMWIFRGLLNAQFDFLNINDTEIAMIAAIALFVIPQKLKKGEFILQWNDTAKMAWGILILFGGGLALASGLKESGIVDAIAIGIASNTAWGISLIVITLIVVVLFTTELISNVALVNIAAPVVAGIAIGLEVPMLHVLIPITIASSCAFMLPMATPPNAIVFASGHVKVSQMVKAGFILNCLGVGLLILFYKYIIPLVF
ncbi:SLC13 family permease [Spongiivirga citrea]|uniref:DASS family sodium-coupled anion symporter n=1 Tax=Spongiivirga citrea TaxID=1481457 RepID=A0A6M0CNL1_9FLAO|nr:DASS family sodium-coupled anion symporter [Spongiivirga citrea]NER18533.1 DASS family sodium-coupled anion symporter [Spongiivirga citrea]